MAEYDVLAGFYDVLMADVDYESIGRKLETLFDRFGERPGLLLELGCGTGALTISLAKKGYDMIGLDLSPAMLSAAAEKEQPAGILWLLQDMTSFDLFGTVDGVICCLDGVNHLTEPRQVQRCLNRVSLFLNPEGLLVFDLITPRQYSTCLADSCFTRESDKVFCTWQSRFSGRSRKCRYDLTIFEEREDGAYLRFDEEICQRSYELAEIKSMLEMAGLRFLGAFDADTLKRAGEKSKRIYVVAKKPT